MRRLKSALSFQANAVVRAEAVEALEAIATPEVLPWIRSALLDEHAGVRFAACVALGNLRDRAAENGIRTCASDANENVRLGALYALHRLGDSRHTGRLATYLLQHNDPATRRNAALVLGLLGEPGAVKILAMAMRDADEGVRHHALEAMARLGNADARRELVFLTTSGVGSIEVFAINALAPLRQEELADTFRYKLQKADHVETRLAAARALGLLGNDDGYAIAIQALRERRHSSNDPKEPPQEQALRIRLLAASALSAIGRRDALGPLAALLDEDDPRIGVAVARAILEIDAPANGARLAR